MAFCIASYTTDAGSALSRLTMSAPALFDHISSCSSAAALNVSPAAINTFCPSITSDAIEFCDAARFSMYIDCDMKAFPCSFGHDHLQYGVDLNKWSIKQAWNSSEFESFRQEQSSHCKNCSYNSTGCRTCALELGLNMCRRF